MFNQRDILYIEDFCETPGQLPKNRYLIVLQTGGGDALVLHFITSQRMVPEPDIQEGCIKKDEAGIHCYHFPQGKVIGSENSFAFPLDSFAYMRTDIQFYNLTQITQKYGSLIQIKDRIEENEFGELVYCISKSKFLKRGLKSHIQNCLREIYGDD